MSRTLSSGILSLRFMQKAQRAKQIKEIEVQQAEVIDESKWEVGQAVREAWGLSNERNEQQDTDVHEASYLPFLYNNAEDGNLDNLLPVNTGRRVFSQTTLDAHEDNSERGDLPTASSSSLPTIPPKSRVHPHPRPINLTKGKATLKGFESLSGSFNNDADMKLKDRKVKGRAPRESKRTARESVFESGNIGQDLRVRASTKPTPRVFMKPAGIDEPSKVTASSAKKGGPRVETQAINGTTQKSKIKRERDNDEPVEEAEKQHKKKRKSESTSSG